YGKGGSYEQKKAYDLLVQCEAGLVSITGSEDTPSKTGISIADIAAGMYACSGILTSLIKRGKTGEGSIVEVSMLEALGEWMGYPAYDAAYGGKEPKRTGASHSTIYPYWPFKCGDGETVFIGLQNEREWKEFCENIIEQPDLIDHSDFNSNYARHDNREELKKIIEENISKSNKAEEHEKIEKHKIENEIYTKR